MKRYRVAFDTIVEVEADSEVEAEMKARQAIVDEQVECFYVVVVEENDLEERGDIR